MTYEPTKVDSRRELATELTTMLEGAGFRPFDEPRANEDVFIREVETVPGAAVKVYTSCERGAARVVGADAIRVAGLYKNASGKVFGIVSDTRVNRVGTVADIVSRTKGRMRNVYSAVSTGERCHCGAPKFKSKKGNMVCAELCFVSGAGSTDSAPAESTDSAPVTAYPTPQGLTCRHCGAALKRSRAGRLYCSAICWKTPGARTGTSRPVAAARTLSTAAREVVAEVEAVDERARAREVSRDVAAGNAVEYSNLDAEAADPNLAAWREQVAANAAPASEVINMAYSRLREREQLALSQAAEEANEKAEKAREEAEAKERSRAIDEAIEALGAEEVTRFTLLDFDEVSFDETEEEDVSYRFEALEPHSDNEVESGTPEKCRGCGDKGRCVNGFVCRDGSYLPCSNGGRN